MRAGCGFLNHAHSQNTCSAFHEESLEPLLSLVKPSSTWEDGWGDRTAVPELWCLPASSEVCVNPVLDNRAGQSLNTKYYS